VDLGIERLLGGNPEPEALKRIELGAHHEEQHQELLLTDILHAFFTNPLRPAYLGGAAREKAEDGDLLLSCGRAATGRERQAGAARLRAGCARPVTEVRVSALIMSYRANKVWLDTYSLALRLVTCAEFAAFIAECGYHRPELWLSAGWDAVRSSGCRHRSTGRKPTAAGAFLPLRGEMPLERLDASPVSHVSFFEADAYARWAGKRLATEFEWENAAEGQTVDGNLLDRDGATRPAAEIGPEHGPTQA